LYVKTKIVFGLPANAGHLQTTIWGRKQ